MAENCEMTVENGILTIKIDLKKEFGLSTSGKTIMIGTTRGNASIPTMPDNFKIGVNCYKYPDRK